MIQIIDILSAVDTERQLSLQYFGGDYRSGIYEYIFRSREQDYWLLTVPEYDIESERADITIIGFEKIIKWENKTSFHSRPDQVSAFSEVIAKMLKAIKTSNSNKGKTFIHFDENFDLSRVGQKQY